MVEFLEDLAAGGGALQVAAGLVHPQGDAVQEDDRHTYPLEPRTQGLRKNHRKSRTFNSDIEQCTYNI